MLVTTKFKERWQISETLLKNGMQFYKWVMFFLLSRLLKAIL